MQLRFPKHLPQFLLSLFLVAPACSGTSAPDTGETQNPPTASAADLSAWLKAGYYKSWHCEPMPHPQGPNGVHGDNRVCSNDVLAAASDQAEYPVGSASVKELYNNGAVYGHSVSVRIKTGSSGDAWYWHENGYSGTGLPVCVGCHKQAGSGGTYTGHDFVFIRVK